LIAVVYIWRVVEAAYFRERPADSAPVTDAPASMLIPIWLLVFANLYFGVDTGLTIGLAGDAARTLFGAP
jgi:multicomponent Na+:H+ antiporter subunit D